MALNCLSAGLPTFRMGNLVVWIENTFCGMDPYDQMIFN